MKKKVSEIVAESFDAIKRLREEGSSFYDIAEGFEKKYNYEFTPAIISLIYYLLVEKGRGGAIFNVLYGRNIISALGRKNILLAAHFMCVFYSLQDKKQKEIIKKYYRFFNEYQKTKLNYKFDEIDGLFGDNLANYVKILQKKEGDKDITYFVIDVNDSSSGIFNFFSYLFSRRLVRSSTYFDNKALAAFFNKTDADYYAILFFYIFSFQKQNIKNYIYSFTRFYPEKTVREIEGIFYAFEDFVGKHGLYFEREYSFQLAKMFSI